MDFIPITEVKGCQVMSKFYHSLVSPEISSLKSRSQILSLLKEIKSISGPKPQAIDKSLSTN